MHRHELSQLPSGWRKVKAGLAGSEPYSHLSALLCFLQLHHVHLSLTQSRMTYRSSATARGGCNRCGNVGGIVTAACPSHLAPGPQAWQRAVGRPQPRLPLRLWHLSCSEDVGGLYRSVHEQQLRAPHTTCGCFLSRSNSVGSTLSQQMSV